MGLLATAEYHGVDPEQGTPTTPAKTPLSDDLQALVDRKELSEEDARAMTMPSVPEARDQQGVAEEGGPERNASRDVEDTQEGTAAEMEEKIPHDASQVPCPSSQPYTLTPLHP